MFFMDNYFLNHKHIKLIKIDEKVSLFFHTETMQIYPISDNELLEFLIIFEKYGEEDLFKYYSKNEVESIKESINHTLTSAPKSILFTSDKNQPPEYNTVVLPIVSDCNLNCPYCFAQTDGGFHFGNFSKEDIVKILEFIVKENKLHSRKFFCIVFFGGEPLLNFEVIKFTIEYMKNHYSDFNVFYSITTNGTILNDDIIQFFRANNVAMLISIDGPDNDYNLRYYKNGNKSLNKVISNIEKLKQNDIRIELRATILNRNPYICETFDFLERFELPFYTCFAYSSENRSHNLSTYDSDTLLAIRKQFDLLLEYYKNKFKNKEAIYNKRVHDYINALRFRNKIGLACGAGRSYFTIIANGDIFSCPHFMNDPQYCIGNIDTNLLKKEKYISVNVEDIHECDNCWIKYFCAGNCLAQKISTGKSNDTATITDTCELEKINFEFYIKLFYYAKKHFPEYFIITSDEETLKQEKTNVNC